MGEGGTQKESDFFDSKSDTNVERRNSNTEKGFSALFLWKNMIYFMQLNLNIWKWYSYTGCVTGVDWREDI